MTEKQILLVTGWITTPAPYVTQSAMLQPMWVRNLNRLRDFTQKAVPLGSGTPIMVQVVILKFKPQCSTINLYRATLT